jgi:hypothetical protein
MNRRLWTCMILLGLISIGMGMLNLLSEAGGQSGSAAWYEARLQSVAPIQNDVHRTDAEAAMSPKLSKKLKHLQVPFIINEGQMTEEPTKEVEIAYAADGRSYGFRLGKYDRTQTLVIDPAIQASYVGGTGTGA